MNDLLICQLFLVANLSYAPLTAYPPVLFASVSHPNREWWVAGVAHEPLSELQQVWEISGGCYGTPVRISFEFLSCFVLMRITGRETLPRSLFTRGGSTL